MGYKILKTEKRRYPVCPECGKHTIVLFTPPKEPADFSKLGSPEYVDWERAHIYCCNGETNCTIDTPLDMLTTPLAEPK